MNLVSNGTLEIVPFSFGGWGGGSQSVEQTAFRLSTAEPCIGVRGNWKYFSSAKSIPLNKPGNDTVCVCLSGALWAGVTSLLVSLVYSRPLSDF